MKRNQFTTGILMCAILTLGACSSGSDDGGATEPYVKPTPEGRLPINISPGIATRATDYSFENGDKIGLYVVNRTAVGAQQALKTSGNHVDNVGFTYNGAWTGDRQTYWADNTTHADFYIYYPYASTVSNAYAYPVSVPTDQSTEAAYRKGDFLAGNTQNVAPTESTVSINAKHAMSQIQVVLAAGSGLTDEALAEAKKSVRINNVKAAATVNLQTGKPTATGSATSVTPWLTDGTYKAIIVPQTVEECSLITVTVDGREYNLTKAFTFESGKTHKFTVTIGWTSSGVDVVISGWDSDGTDNGGTAELRKTEN